MKIALVIPDFLSGTSFLQQPIDFLYCARDLENHRYDVSVIDCRVKHTSVVNTVQSLKNFDLIFVTTTPGDQVQNYFLDYRYSYAIYTINKIKENLPHIPLIVCGAHASVRPDLVLKEAHCDILLKGETFHSAVLIANAFREKTELLNIPNIIYKKDGELITTKIDLDIFHPTIPDDLFPAYDKINMKAYFGDHYENNIPVRKRNRVVLQGGRGCPFSCTFCHNFFGKNIKRRDVSAVIHEMDVCQKVYGMSDIFFLDEVFTLNKTWVMSLCEEILRKNLKYDITAQTRVDCLDKEMLALMSRAGFTNLWIGVESANDHILTINNKGTQIEDINKSIDMIRGAKIEPYAFFMLGMPGETIATLNQTLKQIYDYKTPYTRSIMICTPRYGTEYYNLALKQYPNLEEHWFNLNAVKGLVANEMTPHILQKAKNILKNRDFIYQSKCPQI